MRNKATILKILNCSESDLFDALSEVHQAQVKRCSCYLPQYVRHLCASVLGKSVAFRNWFVREVDIHDGYIIELSENGCQFSLNQYKHFQNFYFENRYIFPPNAVIELACSEYKDRVSLPEATKTVEAERC